MPLLRRSRSDPPPLAEADVYARSYGDRSDDVTVMRVPELQPAPEHGGQRLTDRKIRDAFRTRLDRRDGV